MTRKILTQDQEAALQVPLLDAVDTYIDNVHGEDVDSGGFGAAAEVGDGQYILAVVAQRFPADEAHQVDKLMRRLMKEFGSDKAIVDTGKFASH